jgi:hypothetical protein
MNLVCGLNLASLGQTAGTCGSNKRVAIRTWREMIERLQGPFEFAAIEKGPDQGAQRCACDRHVHPHNVCNGCLKVAIHHAHGMLDG